jgi:uncharacterized damage-inducible protein DinB
MKISDILLMFDYNYWANELLLAKCEALTAEQFTDTPHPHSYGTIQRTLIHILDSEWGWRVTLQQQQNYPELDEHKITTLAALREQWTQDKAIMVDWLRLFTDEDLERSVRYPIEDGKIRERVLWHCLYHVVNHGMQHRSEVAAMLTTVGLSPGDIDFTHFLNERGLSPALDISVPKE